MSQAHSGVDFLMDNHGDCLTQESRSGSVSESVKPTASPAGAPEARGIQVQAKVSASDQATTTTTTSARLPGSD